MLKYLVRGDTFLADPHLLRKMPDEGITPETAYRGRQLLGMSRAIVHALHPTYQGDSLVTFSDANRVSAEVMQYQSSDQLGGAEDADRFLAATTEILSASRAAQDAFVTASLEERFRFGS